MSIHEGLEFDGQAAAPGPDACADASGMRQGEAHAASFRTLRGGHDPRELAQRRWAKQRERQDGADSAPASEADHVRLVTVPARIGKVIAALEREAANGNANAARELRGWLAEYPPDDTELSVEKLDKKTRQRALAYVLARLAEEDAAAAGNA
jgi:hypothetical protein